jgi:hypothetical protein
VPPPGHRQALGARAQPPRSPLPTPQGLPRPTGRPDRAANLVAGRPPARRGTRGWRPPAPSSAPPGQARHRGAPTLPIRRPSRRRRCSGVAGERGSRGRPGWRRAPRTTTPPGGRRSAEHHGTDLPGRPLTAGQRPRRTGGTERGPHPDCWMRTHGHTLVRAALRGDSLLPRALVRRPPRSRSAPATLVSEPATPGWRPPWRTAPAWRSSRHRSGARRGWPGRRPGGPEAGAPARRWSGRVRRA